MHALVQTETLRSAPFKAIEAPSEPPIILVGAVLAHEPRAFPEASTSPVLPMTIRDETLEFYAFVFCQGGFRQLGMIFERFLLVAAAIKPADWPANREEGWTPRTRSILPHDLDCRGRDTPALTLDFVANRESRIGPWSNCATSHVRNTMKNG